MPPGARVRRAWPGDAPALCQVDYDAWVPRRTRPTLDPASVPFFDRTHGGRPDDVLVATLPSAIVGFVVVRSVEARVAGNAAQITEICVDQVWRRRRLATLLLLAAARKATAAGASTLLASIPRANAGATRLVASSGFLRDRSAEQKAVHVVETETMWTLVTNRIDTLTARARGPSV